MSLPIFLQDRYFLDQLDHLPVKEEYVRITVLDWRLNPIKEILGIVISGNVNLDGNSSMRRTASLTVFAEQEKNDLENINSLFAINKKCKLEKGIKNTVPQAYIEQTNLFINYQELYGDIVWFPLGIYVMFNPAISNQLSGVNISMQLKDKMCLLNGDLGGQIHSPVEFSLQDLIVDENGNSVEKIYTLVYDIIKELVNHWGNENLNKIFISEVPPMIKQVVKWQGSEVIYLTLNTVDQLQTIYTQSDYDKLTPEQKAQCLKILPGRDVGFIYTDFVYPGELSCNAGDTVTSVLDKIIGILGNYEYFYDVEGNFRFQLKQNYLNMSNTAYWTKETDKDKKDSAAEHCYLPYDDYINDYARLTKPVYDFSDNKLFTAYNNTLNYNNIKNDFVVWGSRKISSNSERLIRFHLAIDTRPRHNKDGSAQIYNVVLYKDDAKVIRGKGILELPDFTKNEEFIQYAFYNTEEGVKQYYPQEKDSLIFTLQSLEEIRTKKESEYPMLKTYEITPGGDFDDWRLQMYLQMLNDEVHGTGLNTLEYLNTYFQYYAEIKEEFPKIFNLDTGTYRDNYYDHPDSIDYFIDIIDEDTDLGNYSVSNIGRRSLIIANNNEGINCIFEPLIPDIVFICPAMYSKQKLAELQRLLRSYHQKYIYIPNYIYDALVIGGKFNSCYEKIKLLLYQYTHMNNTISITGLPIYYLLPNTRVTVNNEASGIYGDFIIQSISLPLDISSTMSINAYRAVTKI